MVAPVKRVLIGSLVLLWLATTAWAVTIVTTSYGYLAFDGNELIVRSLNNDPPKVRLEAPEGSLHKGCLTGGTRRPDGRYEELGVICFKQDERFRSDPYNFTGELTISLRKYDPAVPDDRQFTDILLARHDGIVFHVPIRYSVQALPHLRSGDGRYETHQQGDANLVTYDVTQTPWKAVWASGVVIQH